MPPKSPAYRWYPKDILGSARVAMMTAEEECWYRRALDFAWLNGGVPSDPVKLARMIGKGCTKGGARVVLEMFENSDDPALKISERQEIERQKQRDWSEKSAAGGKASAGKRKKLNDKVEQQGGSKGGSTKRTPTMQPKGNIPFPFPEEEINTNAGVREPWKFPMKELIEAFPDIQLTPGMIGLIEADVTAGDEIAWANTLKIYRGNYNRDAQSYLPEKVGTLLKVFETEKAALAKTRANGNGSGKPGGEVLVNGRRAGEFGR